MTYYEAEAVRARARSRAEQAAPALDAAGSRPTHAADASTRANLGARPLFRRRVAIWPACDIAAARAPAAR